jgi:hypothetical protein
VGSPIRTGSDERAEAGVGNFKFQISSKSKTSVTKNAAEMLELEDNETVLPDLSMVGMLMKRVRYFTDGAVIGSKEFVNEAYAGARERFTERRKDGARRMRGSGAAAKGLLWSIRDLRVEV